jgi:peptide/nickel transport system substrate-binding protein
LRQLLYSKNSAPIGKTATTNWERYSNPTIDRLIDQYGATTSSAKQHAIVKKLEAVMVNDIPVIPVTEGVDWYQYNTKSLSGWVTQGNPYAKPAAYEHPDWGVMLLHLKPKG